MSLSSAIATARELLPRWTVSLQQLSSVNLKEELEALQHLEGEAIYARDTEWAEAQASSQRLVVHSIRNTQVQHEADTKALIPACEVITRFALRRNIDSAPLFKLLHDHDSNQLDEARVVLWKVEVSAADEEAARQTDNEVKAGDRSGKQPADQAMLEIYVKSEASLDSQALAVFIEHPDWTKKKIARHLGRHEKSLCPERCPKLAAAIAAHKSPIDPTRRRLHGSKDSEGKLEAWEEE
jgi:hypothetical protein